MPPRFYAPALTGIDVSVALPDAEAAHLARVLRLDAGETVSVFDGRGGEYLAQVEHVAPRKVTVRPYLTAVPAPEPAVHLTVAPALLKGRKFDDVVRDVTMVGAIAVQPLLTDRTEARARDALRWARIAIASAKQCGRAVVPEIRSPLSLAALLDHDRSELRVLLVEPGAGGGALRTLEQRPRPSSAILAVGPEGGWSRGELDAARAAGFVLVTLGRRTFRADAVVVSAVSVLQYLWGDL